MNRLLKQMNTDEKDIADGKRETAFPHRKGKPQERSPIDLCTASEEDQAHLGSSAVSVTPRKSSRIF